MHYKNSEEPLTIAECIQLIATAVVYGIYKQAPDQLDHILLPHKETKELQPKFIAEAAENLSKSPQAQQILRKKLDALKVIPKFYESIKIGNTVYH